MSEDNQQLGALSAKMDLALEMLRETRLWQQRHAGQGPDTEHAVLAGTHAVMMRRLNSHAKQLTIIKTVAAGVAGAGAAIWGMVKGWIVRPW